ncbi:MAG: redoxin domain-containing protein [Oscillospiraceae bacterium]|nr:redoxin domain-containing protein [Oscillospiraceae bacterium]
MDNVKTSWWQNHRPSTRRLVQLYSALLYNAHLKGFIDGEIYVGKTKFACVPGFNCYSCPGAVGACPLGSIQNALASTGNQAGWYVLGIISLFGVILGRTICGWLCPLGLIQELLHKIPTPKIKKSRITRVFTWLKYILLAVFVVALPLWYGLEHNMPLPGFCKYICPAGTFEGAMGLLSNPANTPKFAMLGILFTRKFIIMLGIGLLCIFCYRSFCRFICPLGAIYGFFNRFNIVGVKVDESRCNHCGSCVRSCGMDVRHVGDHECINCGKCMEVCAQKAISIKAGSYTLKAPEGGCADDTERSEASRKHFAKIFWGVALGVLCAALLWFNFLDPTVRKRSAQKPVPTPPAAAATAAPAESSEAAPLPAPAEEVSFESSAPIGYEVGQQLQDFTVSTFDGGEFHLADHRGQIVIINLWGTYCTPCVQELPEFEKLCEEHEGEVAILAVHSSMTGDVEPQDYVVSKGWDKWDIDFTLDDENDTIFTIVNGSTALPQTIVLNRRGEVIHNQDRALTPEMLNALYKQADESVPAAPGGSSAAVPTPPEAPAPVQEAAPVSFESDAPVGYEVGQQLADFKASTFDGGEFHLADHKGQIVIINLWGTYCTPCVQELPEFEKLCEEHEGELVILAVHSSMTGDVEPQDYVVSKGWDKWDIDFTLDDDNDTIFGIVNGSTTLPQTIVLNRRGEVIYNMARSLTPEMLGALYKQADESVPAAPGSGSAIPTPPENSAAAAEPAAAAQPAAVPSPALTEASASESTEQAAPAPAAEAETAENSDSFVFDAPAVGFHFEVPEKYRHLKGSLDWSGGYLDDGILQFTATYYAIPKDRIEEYFDYIGAAVQAMAAGEEVPEAPVPGWDNYGISTVAYDAFSISSDRSEEDLRQELKDHNGWRGDNFGWFEKIGSDGEYSFYIGQYAELEENKEKHRDAMGDCFEEFEEIVTDRDGFLSALTLKAPDQQKTNLEIGETVAFETTDLDGNPISSKDLFAAGRVTMINLWATWCHACINELPELAEIAKEYEGKGCRIVGICLDADEEGIPAEAKEILKEAGVEYLNLVPPEGVENLLPTICYPTSFLFDSEGRLIAEPIRGAHIEEYRPALDKALDQTGASSNGPDGKVL